jgi:hypothetical protein
MTTNVAATVGFTSTLHLYDISNPLAPTPITVGSPTAVSALGMAIDAGNTVYFLTQDVPATTVTFHACTAPGYTCQPVGTASAIAGGQWLAIDGLGNAYATQISGTSSGVVKFSLATGPTSSTLVYTSAAAPGAYYGLAVSASGGTLYVSEGPSGVTNGTGVTVHACATPCSAGGTDITPTVRTAAGVSANLSGALAVDGLGTVHLGTGNSQGSSVPAGSVVVALSCVPGSGNTYACTTGSAAFTGVGGLSPWAETAAIANDPSGNVYTAALLAQGSASTAPIPSINAFTDSSDSLDPFACTTTTGSPAVPNCPINLLPGPPVFATASNPPPYSMAATAVSAL